MQKSKTYFEQIPVAVVKKIAQVFHEDAAGNGSAVIRTSPGKWEQHRVASLRKNGRLSKMQLSRPEMNCAICHQSVALDASKTDEFGQAIHGECYLLKVGRRTLSTLRHKSDEKIN
jgi:hypothetical protein